MIPSICAQKGQRRGFAALDTGNFDESTPRHDPAGYDAACRHQPRSDDDRGADTKYVGLRREHDDQPGHARDDGAGQCHRCHGNPRRIASAGLLMRECHDTNSSAKSQILLGGIAMTSNATTFTTRQSSFRNCPQLSPGMPLSGDDLKRLNCYLIEKLEPGKDL